MDFSQILINLRYSNSNYNCNRTFLEKPTYTVALIGLLKLFTWLISFGQSTLVKKVEFLFFLPRFEDERWWSSTLHGAASSFCLTKNVFMENRYLDIKAHIMQKYMIDGAGAILVKSFFLQKAWTKIQLATKLRYSSN